MRLYNRVNIIERLNATLLFGMFLVPLINNTIFKENFEYFNVFLLCFILLFLMLNFNKIGFEQGALIAPAVLFSALSLLGSFEYLHSGGFVSYVFNLLLLLFCI